MRILWIAGLGAVLIAGGASAQGMNAPQGSTMNERALNERQPGSAPDMIRSGQDPRLTQERLQTRQNTGSSAPIPPGLQASPNDRSPDNTRQMQDPRLNQGAQGGRSNVRSSGGDARQGAGHTATERRARTTERRNAPRDEASRAYMGGGMILENGRPVPLPGDAPGMGSDFRGGQMGQSGVGAAGDRGAQTNVGQTGTRDQGMVGTPQGAFPANPPTPGGRIPTGN